MKKIVVKFGGSNLRTDEDPSRILKIVESYHQPVVIVVSAFYGMTNYLQELIWKVRYDQDSVKPGVEFIRRLKQDTLLKNIHHAASRER
ncbi:MAG: hypothetical protein J7K63_03330, partial [Candidatus Marinimicrobia bacterium]|nr:hypothetical protein [Candidatus Neomarinimicrobiota bacterium]